MRLTYQGRVVEVLPEGHCFLVPNGFHGRDRKARVFVHVNKLERCNLLDLKVGDQVAFTLTPQSTRYPDNIKAGFVKRVIAAPRAA